MKANSFLLPRGFRAAGLHSGIGKKKNKPDLALFFSERSCNSAAVFTANRVQAAPVIVSREHIAAGQARAIVVNSGCANACTGEGGLADARRMCREAAESLGVSAKQVLVASTGVIGARLPMSAVESGIRRLSGKILAGGGAVRNAHAAVWAMMTTDTVPKTAARRARSGGGAFTIWGCVKGAGMIHPDMATMISVILTDAALPSGALKRMLKAEVDGTFNSLSVDGDTSTNDTVFLLANGLSGVSLRSRGELSLFQKELGHVCESLALQMARDGEGATKRVVISVRGARSDAEAKKAASTVATSPLVKTALFGLDANWGRIIAAIGRSGAAIDPDKVEIAFDGVTVCRRGASARFSEKAARQVLQKEEVPVRIDLHQGRGEARYLTCDFSFDYVKINAEYRT